MCLKEHLAAEEEEDKLLGFLQLDNTITKHGKKTACSRDYGFFCHVFVTVKTVVSRDFLQFCASILRIWRRAIYHWKGI